MTIRQKDIPLRRLYEFCEINNRSLVKHVAPCEEDVSPLHTYEMSGCLPGQRLLHLEGYEHRNQLVQWCLHPERH